MKRAPEPLANMAVAGALFNYFEIGWGGER